MNSRDAMAGALATARASGRASPVVAVERLFAGRSRSRRWLALVSPVVVAVLVVWAVVYARAHQDGFAPAVAVVLALAATGPLALIGRWPLPALGLVLAANAVYVTVARLSWPATAVLAWLVAMTGAALALSRRTALLLLVLSEAAVAAAVFVPESLNATPWDATVAEALALLLAWGVGESLRARRDSASARAEVDARLRGLQEREAVARGRAEIARELHDVVAHHVSLVAVRAATVPYEVPELPGPAREAFAEIAAQARTALEELRAVLGVLRTPDGPPHAPQPGLSDLPALVDRTRASAVSVSLDTVALPTSLPEPLQLCCYRVVQEALTNAARHAPGSRVSVTVTCDGGQLTLRVSDTGRPGHGRGQTVPGGTGYGLVGMRERVALLGGQLHAGPRGGGWVVSAQIPIPDPPGGSA